MDPVRYYLLRAIATTGDGDFSVRRIHQLYTTDLANGLGNLLSRLTTLCEKSGYENGQPPESPPSIPAYHEEVAEYRLDDALSAVWREIGNLNRAIDSASPWKAFRETGANRIHGDLTAWIRHQRQIADLLRPFLPQTAGKIDNALQKGRITKCEALFPRLA